MPIKDAHHETLDQPVRECWQEMSYASDGPFSSSHIGGTLLGSSIGVVVGTCATANARSNA